MQFSNPGALWFLFALIIPIIIHLFYFRRYRRVFFSDTRFLFEAKEVQRNASRLKHLLVLASRLLAFAMIILAFAQPFRALDNKNATEADHVSLFIDNSFSMEAGGKQLSLLEEAKQIAINSVRQYPDHYSFHVFDHNFSGSDQQWIDKENAINKIKRTALTGAVKSLSQIVNRQRQMRERLDDGLMSSYILSDGQSNLFKAVPDFEQNEYLQFIRLNPVFVSNISVDSLWMDDPVILPGQTSRIYVQLSNYGTSAISDVGLSFKVNEESRPAGSMDIPAGQSTIDTIPLTFSSSGWKELEISIEDEAIRFDDAMLATLQVTERVRILLISNKNNTAFYRAATQGNKRTELDHRRVQNIVYSDFVNYDLIIVDGLSEISTGLSTEIGNFVNTGGNVLFFPDIKGDLSSYNRLFKELNVNTFNELIEDKLAVNYINRSSYIFKNVYRYTGKNLKTPSVNTYFELSKSVVAGREKLLDLRNRAPYLVGYRRAAGNFYLCTAPTDESYTDILSNGSFFVPMLHRMSISSRSGIEPYYTIGGLRPITITSSSVASDPVYKLLGEIEVIPARFQRLRNTNLYAGDQINRAGIYKLITQDSTIARIAYNYDRSESDLAVLSNDAIADIAPEHITVLDNTEETDIAEAIVNQSKRTTFWKTCLLLALAFLLCEQLLLRYFRA